MYAGRPGLALTFAFIWARETLAPMQTAIVRAFGGTYLHAESACLPAGVVCAGEPQHGNGGLRKHGRAVDSFRTAVMNWHRRHACVPGPSLGMTWRLNKARLLGCAVFSSVDTLVVFAGGREKLLPGTSDGEANVGVRVFYKCAWTVGGRTSA